LPGLRRCLEISRTVLVESTLFAVHSSWLEPALRSFRSRVDCRIASNAAIDLPCPWAPLQSMTAVATRRLPVRLSSG
jgi:hypothetical protein